MSVETKRTEDGTLVVRVPHIVARCVTCDVGILAGADILRGFGGPWCSLSCGAKGPAVPAPAVRWWAERGANERDDALHRITVDWAITEARP